MTDPTNFFPDTYETSRERFRHNLTFIQQKWPEAYMNSYQYDRSGNLTTDWIEAEALQQNERVFIMTTGEHGIEGYVGSAMMQRFIEVFLFRLDPKNTGLLLLHAINPWGMKNRRRTNAGNIDLNRNFVWDSNLLDPTFNPEHREINAFVNPQHQIESYWGAILAYLVRLPRYLMTMGFQQYKKISLLGHYYNPKGVHFGGDSYQEETRLLINLYRETFKKYGQLLHLDMHTGYGPRYQMSLVNSFYERGNSQDFVEEFNYPLVVAANTEEFYDLRGDMIDYIYTLWHQEFPGKRLYSNSFEFGTYGRSIISVIRTMLTMTMENQAFHFGCRNSKIQDRVKKDFLEAFYPQAWKWQQKAIADADQAFEGILRAQGYFD